MKLSKRPGIGARTESAFRAIGLLSILLPLMVLAGILLQLAWRGSERISPAFFSSFPSRKAELAGIYPALVGSLFVVSLTAIIAVPIGIGAAVYLEEYAAKTKLSHWIEINFLNLAGVPSIIYGLLGLGVFVRTIGMGHSVIAGAATLAILVLPVITVAAREAIKRVPDDLRQAALALGATRFQAVRRVILPQAAPGIWTGVIFAVSRAFGETAPLVVVGAVTYMAFLPNSLDSQFTVLPIQIFDWISRPQPEFAINAAAAILVLMTCLLALNSVALVLRARAERRQ